MPKCSSTLSAEVWKRWAKVQQDLLMFTRFTASTLHLLGLPNDAHLFRRRWQAHDLPANKTASDASSPATAGADSAIVVGHSVVTLQKKCRREVGLKHPMWTQMHFLFQLLVLSILEFFWEYCEDCNEFSFGVSRFALAALAVGPLNLVGTMLLHTLMTPDMSRACQFPRYAQAFTAGSTRFMRSI